MSFNFSDIVGPVATRFNNSFKEFMEIVKRRIKFQKDVDEETYPVRDRNDFIEQQTLKRKLSDGQTVMATFYPSTNGCLDIVYQYLGTGKKIEYKDIPELFFFTGGEYEGHIEEMEDLFEVKKGVML